MRAVIQRVRSASVEVDGEVVSSIGPGLLCLIGISRDDTEKDIEFLSRKLLSLRAFQNEENGKAWDLSVRDTSRELLLVSQFTLHARMQGNRPDFSRAMPPQTASELYAKLVEAVKKSYVPERVKDGIFGAMMNVQLVNDGPVTLILDSQNNGKG